MNETPFDGEPTADHHRSQARKQLYFAVVTVSDSRTTDTDCSGPWLIEAMTAAGHLLHRREIVPDEPERIVASLRGLQSEPRLDVVLLSGGTGLSPRDRTPEAVLPLLEVEIPGFGELFRMLSYQEIGPAAMLSRAFAGRMGHLLIFCLPGSTNAVRLACEKLLIPELPHLVYHARTS